MLTLIRIANYAIVDEIEVELDRGFSVMTGETGAGKSILVDALGLALGDRADSTAVRAGANRAEISAVFEIPEGHGALRWLAERELGDGAQCTLRRVIGVEGRSRAFINNQPVTLDDLRTLGSMLIDIHGQHAHQSLMTSSAQRAVLDATADAVDLAAAVGEAHAVWQEAAAALAARQEHSAEREAQLELLRFQRAELMELALAPQEVESLHSERSRLGNVDRLLQGVDSALNQIYESDAASAHTLVAQAQRSLAALIEHDSALANAADQLGRIAIELREVATELSRYRDRLEADPARLEHVESRLARIRTLAKRHRIEEAELAGMAARLEASIEALERGGESLEQLEAKAAAAEARYFELAGSLSAARERQAAELGTLVSAQLKELGLPHGEFLAVVERKPKERADATGLDRVEFQVRLNPGQPFGALGRVASGGELSRVSLALEVVATGASTIPTFIFDEVDAGIGGGVAEIVGRRLRQIAAHRQVLCVTHLPQVASQGERHYRVVKLTDGKTSRTHVRALTTDERIEELARMLGGIEITERTRAHAEEMIRIGATSGGSDFSRDSSRKKATKKNRG
jgi:DNA repair protein RecN (Recombination protein N)